MRNDRSRSRGGIYAAVAALAMTAGLGVVGAAGADEAANAEIYVGAGGVNCFTSNPAGTCAAGDSADVTINTGETVTWNFNGSTTFHNAASSNAVAADPGWEPYAGPFVNEGLYSRRFTQPGSYEYVCDAHRTDMKGTITVVGDPVPTETATATATATPTASPPANPPPTSGDTTTPPPTGGAADSIKPTLRSVRAKALRRAVRVRFRLSEPATVTVRVKRRGSRKVLKSRTVQAPAGTRSVTLRSKKLKKGRYTVEIRARDAYGNRSSLAKKRLSLRR